MSDAAFSFAKSLIPKESAVLDVGCGDGRQALALSNAGFEVVLIDKDDKKIKAAQALLPDNVVCNQRLSKFFFDRAFWVKEIDVCFASCSLYQMCDGERLLFFLIGKKQIAIETNGQAFFWNMYRRLKGLPGRSGLMKVSDFKQQDVYYFDFLVFLSLLLPFSWMVSMVLPILERIDFFILNKLPFFPSRFVAFKLVAVSK